jgi:putative membrane protein
MNLEKGKINDTGFLGSQGDIWDAQWDMFLALVGAMVAVPLLFQLHDRSMARLRNIS